MTKKGANGVHIDQSKSHFSRKKSRTAQAIEYFQINFMAKDPFEDYVERKGLSLAETVLRYF